MQTLEKFNKFVKEITAENGRNYKLSVLEKYKNDEDIKYYLNFLFNPYITTGISNKKIERSRILDISNWQKEIKSFHTIYDLLEYVKDNNTGKDEILINIECFATDTFYAEFHEEEQLENLFDSIITKNLQLGIDSKTINKVIPGTIQEFNVMLANKYFDNPKVIEGKDFAITTKIDGMRCIMLKENGNVTFWSRQGQKIEGLVDLEEEAMQIKEDNFIFDCELVAIADLADTYKQTMQKARTKDATKHGLKLKVFDWLPLEDFKNQSSTIPYVERRKKLEEFF